ncbi:nidogen-like domain-containing protein [Pseudooceanicola sp. C21-150M6]|uniref:nidogen-like domain-containing protein n=1 Tax=Pseudooceanicola sp. C21-150M6 TaxID=3434355 RepID=UPI003D7FDD6E
MINDLGGDYGFGTEFLDRNDDGSTSEIDITSIFESGLNFFGATYTSLFVNNNGSVTFDDALSQYTPDTISGGTVPGFFPYWGDVDTRSPMQDGSPGGTSQGTNLVWYALDEVNDRIVITWDDVGFFSSNTSLVNSFQLIIEDVSDAPGRSAGDADVTFIYEQIDWTAGDASGGSNGLGGTAAHAGFSAGNAEGTYFELPQSGFESELLELENTPGNGGETGIWFFQITNGDIELSAPIARNDDVTIAENGSEMFNVLANDTDPDGDALSIVSFDASGLSGVLTNNSNGDFEYTPAEGFVGTETFTYVVTDGVFEDTATVTFTVEEGEDTPPSAEDGLRIRGTGVDDALNGGAGDDTVLGLYGDDDIFAAGGDDLIFASFGDDSVDGGTGADSINGGEGDDELTGGSGDDRLKGQDDDDVLDGGLGDDSLFGGTGSDEILAGFGDDMIHLGVSMQGDGDADLIVIDVADTGDDTVNGFDAGIDMIDLNGAVATVSFTGAHTLVEIDGGGSLLLRNFDQAEFDAIGGNIFVDPLLAMG